MLVLVLVYRDELSWARRALPAEFRGEGYPPHVQWALYDRAESSWASGGEAQSAIELLERSLAIEPNAPPMVLLGEIHFADGKIDRALELFQQAVDLDPAFLLSWLRIAEVYKEQGLPEKRLEILRQGLEYFTTEVERFRPQVDRSVWEGPRPLAHRSVAGEIDID